MTCPHCGFEAENARVCPSCGRRLRGRGKWVALGIAVGVLLVAAAVVAVWLLKPSSAPPPSDTDAQEVSTTVSNTVRVTVPEGYTVERIATLMEEKEVCTAEEFRNAVQNGDFSDFDFVAQIPLTGEDGAPNGRVWRLEGYLFPDTYEFYKHCGGETAVRRFLQNFARKYADLQPSIAASGLTLDEAVTLASIIQWEAGSATDMRRVSRVLWNRLESPDYPRLQCDTTTRYLRELDAAGVTLSDEAKAVYDTYKCRNLPVGAINNPGLAALSAAAGPSDEEICAGCFFFVTDAANNTVYYSKTYAEHVAACREHKLGAYA